MPDRKTVMISSTARDLPEHRKEAMDACLRQGMFPTMMEHLPASDDEAISASLALVDRADIYVGIFAHRYGYVPAGHAISVTEMEYNRAVERKIPHLIFVMDKAHPITIDDVELGEGAARLEAFKKRLLADNIVNFFKSPADLRALVINSLSQLREPDLTAFHYVSDIPAPPEAYIAHPYTLLQTHRLVGRQAELNLLTDWVAGKTLGVSETPRVSIFNIVAIGGMGKSALTWKWFNEIAPQEMQPLAGRIWWSFYESDATFENFVIRALAYVTGRAREEIEKSVKPGEREELLLTALDRAPFLLVLDGLERILIAYARMDAARLADSQIGNQRNLRKTADPRVGSFLRKLTQVRHSRILVSSRLYPAELEMETGAPIAGSCRRDIIGLTDEDAVELWRAFGVTGSRDELLPIFVRFDKHPLLIQALAGEVKNYRRAPGDFAAWRKANPNFDPAACARTQEAMAHVLEHALRGLNDRTRKVLHTIAAFRMPAPYDTLVALLVLDKNAQPEKRRLLDAFRRKPNTRGLWTEQELDRVLVELEDRGLLGWDRHANRYDLHPIVRGVVWNGLTDVTRNGVFSSLHAYFGSVPDVDEAKISSLEDLTPLIELYSTLIGLRRYDEAEELLFQRLYGPSVTRLGQIRQIAMLYEMLFPDGIEQLPRLRLPEAQTTAMVVLAHEYTTVGRLKEALLLMRGATSLFVHSRVRREIGEDVILFRFGEVQWLSGHLRESVASLRRATMLSRKGRDGVGIALALSTLMVVEVTRGNTHYFSEFRQIVAEETICEGVSSDIVTLGTGTIIMAATLMKDFLAAQSLCDYYETILSLAGTRPLESTKFARWQGQIALGLEQLMTAQEHLHGALIGARAMNFTEEELPALVALAELRRRQEDPKAARELLDDVWEPAERGPYPLIHADAYNVLAQIERDAGHRAAAVEAATKAYRLAWCDGEPYAYHWGVVAARKHLAELGAPEPAMPPFDESKFEPMPEVEINPDDEFHVDVSSDGEPQDQ